MDAKSEKPPTMDKTTSTQEGALAEFTALRSEILARQGYQSTIFSLQVTAIGGIFGFALSDPKRTLIPVVIPFLSYVLSSRFFAAGTASARIGRYIRDELNQRVSGGLGWEAWYRDKHITGRRLHMALDPLMALFPGASIFALIWTIRPVVSAFDHTTTAIPLAAGWLIGAALTVSSVAQTWIYRRHFILSNLGRNVLRN